MQRHELDPVSLFFGVLFCGIAALTLLVAGGMSEHTANALAVPVILVGAGTAGIAAFWRR